MDPLISGDDGAVELLAAHAHIWEHIFSFHKSMALKCAIEVGIPDAIQKHSKPVTLLELASILAIHPTKAPSLGRLMRLLVHTNFFSMKKSENGEIMFDLTISSQLLLKDHPLSQVAFIFGMLNPIMIDPAHHLSTWLNSEAESPFHVTHGRSIWEHANAISMFNDYFNQAMASDARFVARFFTSNDNKIKGFFEGIKSLVDVGGGDGTMAKAIAEAYPELKCIVLDLPHVVEGLKGNGSNLVYIGGDMFRSIPLADAVLLKVRCNST
uniref:Uncharacterized protein n=1 Tax=Opuntia streptacantha TaxID=393608 RepID=A0A7C9CI69_OPUST